MTRLCLLSITSTSGTLRQDVLFHLALRQRWIRMRKRFRSQQNKGSGFSTAICHAAARFALRPLFMPAKGPPKGPQPLPRLCGPAADRVKGPLPLLSGVRLPGNRLAPPFRDSRGRLAPQTRSGRRAGRPLPPEALGGFARAPGAFPAPSGQWPCVTHSGGSGPARAPASAGFSPQACVCGVHLPFPFGFLAKISAQASA